MLNKIRMISLTMVVVVMMMTMMMMTMMMVMMMVIDCAVTLLTLSKHTLGTSLTPDA